MKKKFISILASIGLSLAVTCNVFASTTLIDIGDSYAKTEIEKLVELGIINGYEDHTFKPKSNITREEFAVLICKAFELDLYPVASSKFTDVSDWARPYVGALVIYNFTKGTGERTFGAQDPITREQMATFFVRAMRLEYMAKSAYGESKLIAIL